MSQEPKQRTSLKEIPEWSNLHSELHKRISLCTERLTFYPLQEGDHPVGQADDIAVRTLGYFYNLYKEHQRELEMLQKAPEHRRRRHIDTIDAVEMEMEFILKLYHLQLYSSPTLDTWSGLPIFTVREGNQAVITRLDYRAYKAHTESNSVHKPGSTYSWFQDIALRSIQESSEEAAPQEPEPA